MGIYLIYLVHLPGMSGNFNLFFSVIVIPLFFFASGLTARAGAQKPLGEFVKAKVLRILWPYLLFGGITLLVKLVATEGAVLGDVIGWAKQLVVGRRNGLFAPALWFLPCFFLLSILYELLRRYLPGGKKLLVPVCCVLSLAARLAFDGPVLPWGADYALRYLFYYMLGDLLAQPLEKLRRGECALWVKLAAGAVFCGCGGLNLLFYLYGRGYIPGLFGVQLGFVGQVIEIFCMAMAGLCCVVPLAMLAAPVQGLARLGRATLILCCTETITKTLVPAFFEAIGLTMRYETPLLGLVCTAIFLAAGYYALARPILSYFPWATGRFKNDRNTGKESVAI